MNHIQIQTLKSRRRAFYARNEKQEGLLLRHLSYDPQSIGTARPTHRYPWKVSENPMNSSPEMTRSPLQSSGSWSPKSVNDFEESWKQFNERGGDPFREVPDELKPAEVPSKLLRQTTQGGKYPVIVPSTPRTKMERSCLPVLDPMSVESIYSPNAASWSDAAVITPPTTPPRMFELEESSMESFPNTPQKTMTRPESRPDSVDFVSMLASKTSYPSPDRPPCMSDDDHGNEKEAPSSADKPCQAEILELGRDFLDLTKNLTTEFVKHLKITEGRNGIAEEEETMDTSTNCTPQTSPVPPAEKRQRTTDSPPGMLPDSLHMTPLPAPVTPIQGTFSRDSQDTSFATVDEESFHDIEKDDMRDSSLPQKKVSFPFPIRCYIDEPEDAQCFETLIRLGSENACKSFSTEEPFKKSSDVVVVVSADYVNVYPLRDSNRVPILKLPDPDRQVQLCLFIDEYAQPKYSKILMEMVGNYQIKSLDLRRAKTSTKRRRTIHDLLRLFSVLETLSSIERLYLQDFQAEELELIPFEELLEGNPQLHSVEIRSSDERPWENVVAPRGFWI